CRHDLPARRQLQAFGRGARQDGAAVERRTGVAVVVEPVADVYALLAHVAAAVAAVPDGFRLQLVLEAGVEDGGAGAEIAEVVVVNAQFRRDAGFGLHVGVAANNGRTSLATHVLYARHHFVDLGRLVALANAALQRPA